MAQLEITHLVDYKDLRRREKGHILLFQDIPPEHIVSLPLPTKRWKKPSYAYFASPIYSNRQHQLEQDAPDRWWSINALGGHLLIYTLWSILPFTENVHWTAITLPRLNRSLDDNKALLATVEHLLYEQSPLFFAGLKGSDVERSMLAEMIHQLIPEALLPQYRALTPDFFQWLE